VLPDTTTPFYSTPAFGARVRCLGIRNDIRHPNRLIGASEETSGWDAPWSLEGGCVGSHYKETRDV
jgi:hypothetical protein